MKKEELINKLNSIDHMQDEIECLHDLNSELRVEIMLLKTELNELKSPPKFKKDEIVGEFIILNSHYHTDGKYYEVINKKGEKKEFLESELEAIKSLDSERFNLAR